MESDLNNVFDDSEIRDDTKQCQQRKRVILHFDIDCFYAQVEMIKDPSLVSKPLGIKQKNIVVTCNYVAREKGVVKCAYITDAMKVCPELVLVNGEDLAEYRKSSQQIFDVVYGAGDQKCSVEKLGMDENFMDVTDMVNERIESSTYDEPIGYIFGQQAKKSCLQTQDNICECHHRLNVGSQIAQEIRDKLFNELGITSSCGIAHNKLLAKIGGGKNKPKKQTIIYHETAIELILTLEKLRAIPGLGSATSELLAKKGIQTISDLQSTKVSQINDIPDAQKLIDFSFGIDPSAVKLSGKPLSIGLEDRFKCLSTRDECLEKAKWLLGRLAKLVLDDGRKPQTLKVFIRDYEKDKNDPKRKFAKYSRQCKVSPSSFKDDESIVGHAPQLVQLISKMVDFQKYFHLTLMGVAVTDFVSTEKKTGGIQAFLRPSSSTSTFIKDPKKTPVRVIENEETPAMKRPLEEAFDKEKKKLKLNEEISDEWDPDVFECLPDEVKEELLSQKPNSSFKKISPEKSDNTLSIDIPKGWDREVFLNLPKDMQKELLDSHKKPSPIKKEVKKSSNNGIMKYFSKKN